MPKILPIAIALTCVASTLPAAAAPPPWAPANGRRAKEAAPPPVVRHETTIIERETVIYRKADGSYYCRRSDGTVGLIAGAAIGGLIGNQLAPGKSAPLGTLLGAGAGALIGQQLDRGSLHCE
jgi:hypothetical protein